MLRQNPPRRAFFARFFVTLDGLLHLFPVVVLLALIGTPVFGALAITTTSLPNGDVGLAYSQTLAATGGSTPYVWSVFAGALPAGLSLSAAGAITGTPTAAGTFSFTARVVDSLSASATAALSITVNPALVITTPGLSLPDGDVGLAYSQTLAATGGSGGFVWSLSAGTLPAGLSLSAAGVISGTPTFSGSWGFLVRVVDSLGGSATKNFAINTNPALSISTPSLPAGTIGQAYSQSLAATGGSGGNGWSVSAGALPAGLSLSGAGAITGAPTATGTFSFTARVVDSIGGSATKALSIIINPNPLTITTTSLPGGTIGQAYSQSLAASGGMGGNIWSILSGALPAGLSLSGAGAITGAPTAAGTVSFIARVVDSGSGSATATLSISVYAGLAILTSTLPPGITGSPYSQNFSTGGGTPPYAWMVAAGALPGGLSLSGAGVLSGTPQMAGESFFTVRVTDALAATDSRDFHIGIDGQLVGGLFISANFQIGIQSAFYSATVPLGGGTAPYTLAISAGTLPPGLLFSFFSPSGSISGTPTVAGDYPITFHATDAGGRVSDLTALLQVRPPPQYPQWTVRGISGGNLIQMVTSPRYAGDRMLFAVGTGMDLYSSMDSGQSWSRVLIPANYATARLYRLVLPPTYDGLSSIPAAGEVFVASDAGVWKSMDHGGSFAAANNGLCASCKHYNLAASPAYATDRTLWVMASGNVYRSTDSAASWVQLSTPPSGGGAVYDALSVSPNYANDRELLLTNGARLYRSLDGGISWTQILDATALFGGQWQLTRAVYSPNYAADRTFILENNDNSSRRAIRSADAGATYSTINIPVYNLLVTARPGRAPLWLWRDVPGFTIGGYQLHASDTALRDSMPLYAASMNPRTTAQPTGDLAAGFAADGHLHVFTSSKLGVAASLDDGFAFSAANRGLIAQQVYTLSNAGNFLAAGGYDGWYRSADFGANWTLLPPSDLLASGSVDIAALSPNYAADHTLFMDVNQSLSRSTDAGQTYTRVTQTIIWAHDLAFAPGYTPAAGTVFLAANTGLLVSTNGGGGIGSFSSVPMPPACNNGAEAYALALSPSYALDATLFVSVGNVLPMERVCKSANGGLAWTPLSNGLQPISGIVGLSPNYNNNGLNGTAAKTIVVVDDQSGVLRSTDGGATWVMATGAPGPPMNLLYGRPVFSPLFPLDNTVFIISTAFGGPNPAPGGIWRSSDGGISFAPLGPGDPLLTRRVTGLQFLPGFDGRNSALASAIASSASTGIWRSDDGGRSFQSVSGYKSASNFVTGLVRSSGGVQGLTNQPAAAAPPGAMFASTADQGVFQSDDNGISFTQIAAGLPVQANAQAVALPAVSQTTPVTAVRDAASSANQGLYRYITPDSGVTWYWSKISATGSGNFVSFLDDGTNLFAARADGMSVKSTDGGVNWSSLQASETDLVKLDFNAQSTPTFLNDPATKAQGPRTNFAAAVTAGLWAVSASSGPRYSLDSGSSWTATPGTNDYLLPGGQTWSVIRALGVNAATGSREVVAGSATGLYRSNDGGATWRSVSGAGSGLESTSKNFSAAISTTTSSGGTDILVGATGSTLGGVYLSGDGGEHWTQVNQGFDPANLSISSLIKTSCSGCPVQYYSGSYGGGMYTRTISVVAPPSFPSVNYSCYTGTSCSCATGGGSGPEQGGQSFKLCGSNFQGGAVVEFDGVPATGCTVTATSIGCTSTPPHTPGLASIRVRNPDTRTGYLPVQYAYTTGAPRADNLYVAKMAGNANLSWSCPAAGCTAIAPARIYRSQNTIFSLYVENYNGGPSSAGGTGAYSNTGAISTAQSYFWSVE